jgi:coniferyl-aldehyde dehydrogenase
MAAEPTALPEDREIRRMKAMLASQQSAFAAEPMPGIEIRRRDLDKLKEAIVAFKDRLADAVARDFCGRSRHETYAELLAAVQGIRYARRHLRRWMRPSKRRAGLLLATTSCRVHYQPKGVVGVMVPFNYPLALSLGPMACALAAGNRVMLRMSEATPNTGRVVQEMLASVFDPDRVGVVLGEIETSKAFAGLPFDHLLFTGSTEVGRHVMRAAADNLTPVTLELGGKSPTLIGEDVSIAMAAERICFGKSLNAGQTCVAPDYVLCPEPRIDDFILAFRSAFERMYPDLHRNEDYTSIINDASYRRLQGYLDEARARGAEIVEVNPGGREGPFPGSRKMPVYLVTDVPPDLAMMREEIFGPILPIVGYKTLDEAIRYINERPRPLAINLFETDELRCRQVLDGTHSGGVCINDAITHFIAEDLPFGGVGDSGMGHYHAREGFLSFSHHKAVLSRPRLNTAKVLYAPHGGWLQDLVYRLFLR